MSHNTLVHRAIRPVVRQLAVAGLHPNVVTIARITSALLAAGCFAGGSPALLLAGCVLFAVSALLDRVDGELARQTRRFSRWGHHMDLVGDCCADALAFLGLGYGAIHGPLGLWAPCLALLAAVAVVALFWQFNVRETPAPSPPPVTRAFDPDDAMFAIPLLVLCWGPDPVLLLAGILTPVVAAGAIWRNAAL